ncbi:MAG: hypothetical protein GYA36_20415 [Veillonellaceae bacterium]|nr:hypothetical protein [Veillonellaceae bacterium]
MGSEEMPVDVALTVALLCLDGMIERARDAAALGVTVKRALTDEERQARKYFRRLEQARDALANHRQRIRDEQVLKFVHRGTA